MKQFNSIELLQELQAIKRSQIKGEPGTYHLDAESMFAKNYPNIECLIELLEYLRDLQD